MEYVKLGDIVDYQKGYAFKSELYSETGVMVVRVTDFSIDSIDDSSAVYINPSDEYRNHILKFGDILIQTVGSWANNPNSIVGKVVQVPMNCDGAYLNQNIVRIIPREGVDKAYLFYALKANNFPLYCVNRGQGAANQASITIPTIMRFKFSLHNYKDQCKIGRALSVYRDFINNNNRRIRLLEQMAENLYKEWFSYHRIKPISSEISLTDIISITRGLSYSSEEIDCDEGNDLINLKNIQSYGGFRLDGTKKYSGKHKKEQIVIEGDLVMGVTDMTQDRRTVGSVALIPNTINLSVISADLIKLTSTIDNVFLYAMFRWGGVSKYISQFANGANVLHLRPQALKNVKILLPSNVFIDKYVSIVKPMIATINKLNTENEQLSRQRDLLLPRLMSGKLEV